MIDRLARVGGMGLAWTLLAGVAVKLAPKAIQDAKELAAETVARLKRLRGRSSVDDADLAQQIREMTPPTAAW